MAYVGQINTRVTIGAPDLLYSWKNALVLAGWRVYATSNGLGSVQTNGGLPLNPGQDNLLTVGDWNNPVGAWCRIKEPSPGTREFILMRGSTSTSALIKYSRQTGFTTAPAGGITLSQCPTTGPGGDGIVWWGNGTDATAFSATTPSAQNVGIGPSSGFISFMASDTAYANTNPANAVWGFWGVAYAAGTGASGTVYIHEAIAEESTPPGDNDPSWRQIVNGGNAWAFNSSQAELPQYWEGYGLSTGVYRRGSNGTNGYGRFHAFNTSYVPSLAAWPLVGASYSCYNGQPGLYPCLIAGTAGLNPKGFSTGVQVSSVWANSMDIYNLGTAEPRVMVSSLFGAAGNQVFIWIPWVSSPANQRPLI